MIEHFLGRARRVVAELHPDGGAGLESLPFYDPVFGVAEFVGEIDSSGKDVERVEHPGGEENAFPRVIVRIGRQFAFGQFENRVAFVEQVHLRLDFPEDADPVVEQYHFRVCRGLPDSDVNLLSARMINGVVEHLGKSVVPDSQRVIGHLSQHGVDIVSPDQILCQFAGDWVLPLPFQQGAELVRAVPRLPGLDQRAFRCEFLQVFVDCLPGNAEMLRREPVYIGRVLLDVFQDETPDVFTPRADLCHGNLCDKVLSTLT